LIFAAFECAAWMAARSNPIALSHRCGFIEIVDAPDKPALAVTPRPVVLGMNIADRQEVRCIVQLRAQSSIFRAQR
jgi:hypothetical protein